VFIIRENSGSDLGQETGYPEGLPSNPQPISQQMQLTIAHDRFLLNSSDVIISLVLILLYITCSWCGVVQYTKFRTRSWSLRHL